MTVGMSFVAVLCYVVVLSSVAGSSSLDAALAQVARNGTVLMTSTNYGYLNHVHNFKCYLDRLGLRALLVSTDERAHEAAQRTFGGTLVSVSLANTTLLGSTPSRRVKGDDAQRTHQIRSSPQSSLVAEEGPVEYHTHAFHVVTVRKIEAVIQVLQRGFDVLFVDADVALLRDPWKHLPPTVADYVFSSNKVCPAGSGGPFDFANPQDEGNTGFFFVRATPGTIALLNATVAAAPSFPGLDDQSIFWRVARATKAVTIAPMSCSDPRPLPSSPASAVPQVALCPLDECVFSVGALRGAAFASLQSELTRRGVVGVSVHANWIKGNAAKAAALAARGLWLAQPDGRCGALAVPF